MKTKKEPKKETLRKGYTAKGKARKEVHISKSTLDTIIRVAKNELRPVKHQMEFILEDWADRQK